MLNCSQDSIYLFKTSFIPVLKQDQDSFNVFLDCVLKLVSQRSCSCLSVYNDCLTFIYQKGSGITLGCGFAALTRYYRKCRTKRMKTCQTAAEMSEMPQSFCVMSGSCDKKSNSLSDVSSEKLFWENPIAGSWPTTISRSYFV